VIVPLKQIILGSALWGWGVEKRQAFEMLDMFARRGGRVVDMAANYPIDRDPEHFQLAANWLEEWLAVNGNALDVFMKIGSMDNQGGANANLAKSFVLISLDVFRAKFGTALFGMAVHWDNRDDAAQIADTLDAFRDFAGDGLAIGLSGIRHPALYAAAAPDLADRYWVQVKENLATRAARAHLAPHFPKARYFAYGINMGGVKLGRPGKDASLALRGIAYPADLVERAQALLDPKTGPRTLNELALAAAYGNDALAGVIVGARDAAQLAQSLDYWAALAQNPVSPVLAQKIADFMRVAA
jgi:aryl-alcohol dehydrogenase-like predicted oxidoreductase